MCKGYSYLKLLNLVPELYSDCILIWTLTHISRSCHHMAICWGEEHGWRGPGKDRGDSLLTGLLSSIILSLHSSTLNITKSVFLNASISCFRFLLFAYLYILTFPKWNYIRKLFLQVKSATPLHHFILSAQPCAIQAPDAPSSDHALVLYGDSCTNASDPFTCHLLAHPCDPALAPRPGGGPAALPLWKSPPPHTEIPSPLMLSTPADLSDSSPLLNTSSETESELLIYWPRLLAVFVGKQYIYLSLH